MYVPQAFQITDTAVLHDFIRKHPFGLLVSGGEKGLQASPLPFFLSRNNAGADVLRAHCARANQHWKALAEASECLVVFQGMDNYVAPAWCPTKQATGKVVPTWNYITVHVWGAPQVIDADVERVRAHMDEFILAEEGKRAHPWAVSDAPADYVAAMLQAVVGLEIVIGKMEGKWKMSQNKDMPDKQGIYSGLRDPDDPHHNAVAADEMFRRNV